MTLQFSLASEIAENAEWPSVALGEVVDILDSRRKPITKRDRVAGPYPYYGATGILDWVEGYIFDEPLVLIGEDGAKWGAGEASAFPVSGKVWVNNHAHVMRPDRESLLDEWLIYYLNAADLSEFISGMTVPKLNQGRLKEIPIPIPPLEQQKRIVAVLDQAFAGLDRARANAEGNLSDADGMVQIEIDRAFAELAEQCDHRSFEDITKTTLIGLVRSKREQTRTGEFAYVKMNHISNDNRFINEIFDRVVCEPNEFPRFQIRLGDFLFNTRNSRELVGKSCVVDSPISDKTVFNNNIMRVRFLDEINPQFVAFGFRSTLGQRQLEEMKSGTTNVVAIYHKSLKRMKLPIPTADIQNVTARRLSALEEKILLLKDFYEETLTDLEDLRRSLLTKAFAGELT